MPFKRPTKDQAKEAVKKLANQFFTFQDRYKSTKDYDEANIRLDLIDPFFKALGWNVGNEGLAPDDREVIVERGMKVKNELNAYEKANKKPDYCFKHDNATKFFVEAKHPSIYLKTGFSPAYQLRRYGYSEPIPISILTDFEEFVVYDCTVAPNLNEKDVRGFQMKYLTYDRYVPEFDYLWDHFSFDAVKNGRFDKYAKKDTKRRGISTLDLDFVGSLDGWREILARDIVTNNPKISSAELNFSVQNILDRIIFLRVSEDKNIEPYEQLTGVLQLSKGKFYSNLVKDFERAALKYNSDLFNFERDTITPKLKISDAAIEQVLRDLYVPLSPYVFSAIPVEILGNAYERFLGKTIAVTADHKIKIEDKPEVRKAGGVFYTPQYIVDYIVGQTIGKWVTGKTPDDVAALRVLDPSCGSGSFLLGAFRFLLDWHKKYYLANTAKYAKSKIKPFDEKGFLTNAERKRILTNNLFGVDLDPQAVEVTKLSLLLKALEGETASSVKSLGLERVLPSLDKNIKCGNSLVGLDFPDESVRPFGWKQAFPGVFANKGFDIVIGNPPYVRQELLGATLKNYLQTNYKVSHGTADLYAYFFEKGMDILKPEGVFSIIVANKWMRANYGEPLRRFLKNTDILEISDFGDLPVFNQATTYPCIITLRKSDREKKVRVANIRTLDFGNLATHIAEIARPMQKADLDDSGWSLAGAVSQNLLKKIAAVGVTLDKYVDGKIYYGIKTGLNEAFVIDEATKKALIKADPKAKQIIKPFLAGRDIKRNEQPSPDKFLILIPRGVTNKKRGKLSPEDWMEATYPSIWEHFKPFKEKAIARYDQGEFWWELRACEYYDQFEVPKITVPAIVKSASYAYDTKGIFSNDKTFIIPHSDKYLLAILNSKACDFYLKSIASTKQGGYFEYKPMYVSKLPIPVLDLKKKPDLSAHTKIVGLADELIGLTEKAKLATTHAEKEQAAHRVSFVNDKLDAEIYKLYDLTGEEIELLEAG